MNRRFTLRRDRSRAAPRSGFTLIETLVALLIVAGGLLGNIALHVSAIRHNAEANLHVRAVRLGGDVAAALRLFPEAAGHYAGQPAAHGCISSAALCSADEWARLMLEQWQQPGADTLSGVSLRISGGPPPAAMVVDIAWNGPAGQRHRWRQAVPIEPGS